MATGRPSLYTPERFDEICARISKGEPRAQICRSISIGTSTVYDWMAADTALAGRFARARAEGFDVIAEDCLEIADDRDDDPASRRVRVETRLKLLAKWDPKRYGDRVELAGSKDQPLTVQIVKLTEEGGK